MTTGVTVHRTPYERRRDLVTEVVEAHTAMDHEAALLLATAVLQTVDHIPETIR